MSRRFYVEKEEEPESLEEPAPVAVEPPTPPPASSASPTLTVESSVSETINECVSEGQWLISVHSEGQVPVLPVEIGQLLSNFTISHQMAGGSQ